MAIYSDDRLSLHFQYKDQASVEQLQAAVYILTRSRPDDLSVLTVSGLQSVSAEACEKSGTILSTMSRREYLTQ